MAKNVDAKAESELDTGSWFGGGQFVSSWILLIPALFSAMYAIGVLTASITSTALEGGPEFNVDSDIARPGTSTAITPTELDDTWLRIGWSFSWTLILLGAALLFLTIAQVHKRVPAIALFSEGMRLFLTKRWWMVMGLFATGRVMQWFLEGRIAEEVGIEEMGTTVDDLSDFWTLDLATVLLWGTLMLGWVMQQGAAVQAATEDIV